MLVALDEALYNHQQQKSVKNPFTNTEKQKIDTFLKKNVNLLRVPGKKECEDCLRALNLDDEKGWKSIKYYIYNKIQSLKRKWMHFS